jgi:hypothetical protein
VRVGGLHSRGPLRVAWNGGSPVADWHMCFVLCGVLSYVVELLDRNRRRSRTEKKDQELTPTWMKQTRE